MSVQLFTNLKTQAATIKNETAKGTNTALRNGTMLEDILDSFNSWLNGKVDKETGKGLSTNDYTTAEKTKVATLVTNGTGTSYLADDGTYKAVTSGGGPTVSQATGQSTTEVMSQKATTDALTLKVSTEAGKGLSENDYTNAAVAKVAVITTNGDGLLYLANDGTYKTVSGGESTPSTETATFATATWSDYSIGIAVPAGIKTHKWKCIIPNGDTHPSNFIDLTGDADGVFVSGSIHNQDSVNKTITLPAGAIIGGDLTYPIVLEPGNILDISSKHDGTSRIWHYAKTKTIA